MKIARYALDGQTHYGLVKGGGTYERLARSPYDGILLSGERDEVTKTKLLCPVENPRIFGVAYNYKAHTAESGKEEPTLPVLFMKPGTAAIGHEESIVFPERGEIIHYEAELVAVIGSKARHVPVETALDHVLGYTCGNDVSDRVIQRQESKFGCLLAGKGYDTFAPLGPYIVSGINPAGLQVTLRQNGAIRQSGNTRDLVHSVAGIVSYLSRFMTLLPGDVIMTGTPAGVGNIAPGDLLEVEISGIGVLANRVMAEERPV